MSWSLSLPLQFPKSSQKVFRVAGDQPFYGWYLSNKKFFICYFLLKYIQKHEEIYKPPKIFNIL